MTTLRLLLVVVLLGVAAQATPAPAIRVAVASNFFPVLEALQDDAPVPAVLIQGATGALLRQALHGAPFDVFLGADQTSAERLAAESIALDVPFHYASGQLMFVQRRGAPCLGADWQGRFALPDPRLAPYGVAAQQVLNQWGWSQRADRIVAHNVAAAYYLLASGNVDGAFLSASLLRLAPAREFRSCAVAGAPPIQQWGALLSRRQDAKLWLLWLRTALPARLPDWGYDPGAWSQSP